ncbi:SdrD B-like domain-containing protein [Pedobacter sp. AW31-3R]|uniref:SdrD B-like domain-containing protein n=1 Tax=Pedobacter sp. AW31-3R TaxID=3445781 RepID=UPI003FA00DE5
MVRERTLMGYFKSSILLFCLLFGSSRSIAQVSYSFSKDTVRIKGGETFSNLLRVLNPYGKAVVLRQDDKEKGLPGGLINLPDSLLLGAGETRLFPVKYMADRQTINRNIQKFGLRLVTADPAVQVQQAAVFLTQLVDVKGLTIDTEESEIYLNQVSNQAQVMIRCANNGFVPITFKLLLNGIPEGLEFIGETMELTLQPGAQQLLPFMARNKGGSRHPGDYTVTIKAVDEQQIQLAMKTIRILNLTEYRRMGAGQFGTSNPNTVSLSYVSLSEGFSYTHLQANGKIGFAEDKSLDYSFNSDLIRQRGYSGLNIYSSFLDYQQKSWGVKLGNIYENVDFNLSGRGIKLSAKLKNKGVLSLLGVENNFMLYTQLRQSPYASTTNAKTAAIDYFVEKGGREDQRLTLSHSSDEARGLESSQLNSKIGFLLEKTTWLGLEAGVSRENQTFGSRNSQAGFYGGLNFTKDQGSYKFLINGFYSSPYYTGIRRGIFSADVNLMRKFDASNDLQLRISVQKSQPRYQDNLLTVFNRYITSNANAIIELKYSNRIGQFQWSVSPYFFHQRLEGLSFYEVPPERVDWRMSALRTIGSASYNGRIHNLSLTADYGLTYLNTSDKPPAPFQSLRINSNYNIAFIGLTAFMQFNPHYLTDVISSSTNSRYRLYTIGPNVHFDALKSRLSVQFGGMYNYYAASETDNYSISGSFRFLTKGNWSLTGDVQYAVTKQAVAFELNTGIPNGATDLQGDYRYNNRQFRVGVEKQFGIRRAPGSKKLELTYFEDHNSNGIKDNNEAVIAGVLVKINGEAALTNTKGIVSFKNMNKESYTVMVTNTKGWSLEEPTTVFLDKNKQLMIPLVKTQALNGRLKTVSNKYSESASVLGGIRINAKDANGKVHHTLTDDNGSFCFYLPRNTYIVYVETAGLPFSIENDNEQVLLAGAPVEVLTFIYRDERRKVGVTRF